jgi:hypothetical protein
MFTHTHSDVILRVLSLVFVQPTPSQAYMNGKHGSPIQFFFTPYSYLIAMMASTSTQKTIRSVISQITECSHTQQIHVSQEDHIKSYFI